MKKIGQLSKFSPVTTAVVACALIVGWLIFMAPIHGYSDNGDFQYLMATNDIYSLHQAKAGYVVQHYGLMKYYNPIHLDHLTAQSVVIQIAVGLNRLFNSQTQFDIRFLGMVYYSLYLGGVGVLVKGLVGTGRKFRHYLMTMIIVLFVADSSFTLYFNSFYPQALTFILLLYLVGFALLIIHYRAENKWLVVGFYLAAILLLMVHESTSLLIVGILIMSMSILLLPGRQWIHGSVAVITVALLFGCWVSANNITPEVRAMNKYQAVTQGKLLATSQPEEIAKTSHIDEQFALMKGQSYYPTAYTAVKPDADYTQQHFSRHYDLSWLIREYTAYPQQFNLLLDKSAKNTMILRPKLTGTQEKTAGNKPFQTTHYFSLFSYVAGTYYPKTYGFNCLLAFAILVIYGSGLLHGLKQTNQTVRYHFWLVLGLLSVVVLVPPAVIVLYGTANFVTHTLPVAVCLSLTGLILMSDVLQHRLWRNQDVA
ncbi:hypothetical protein HC026_08335 [Lactobacillus sp. LC28-10]|uniref:Glycosyltransferase RgtA/B/C/D-like domain-containing protein n=1 Tax=Secundilactobacillus angelensis TaxID=2722706 RepID=A0ABX1KYB7_9LACO|nr:hypothetical protein [Secundilactobacillus angelensis]MCH5462010.1 hypothetical protein [Secundilactobacillus angelensis]NLR18932.1 hypothetical protein [Secundilactobacillus angelensis]